MRTASMLRRNKLNRYAAIEFLIFQLNRIMFEIYMILIKYKIFKCTIKFIIWVPGISFTFIVDNFYVLLHLIKRFTFFHWRYEQIEIRKTTHNIDSTVTKMNF